MEVKSVEQSHTQHYLPTSGDITVGTFTSIYQVSMVLTHSCLWIMN